MNTNAADLIRSIITEDLLETIGAKDFKTKGDDLQFRLPNSKNRAKSNMIKIELIGEGYVVKFYTYNPMKHIFRCNLELTAAKNELKSTLGCYSK